MHRRTSGGAIQGGGLQKIGCPAGRLPALAAPAQGIGKLNVETALKRGPGAWSGRLYPGH